MVDRTEESATPSLARLWFPPIIVSVLMLVTLILLQPDQVLRATTPTGGDMGAHVYGPAFLRDHIIPSGSYHGWSNDWFAGFPLYYFYFPLPSYLIVLLDVLLPYGVAFKLVVIGGLVLMPAAVYHLVRAMRFDRVVASVGATAAIAFMVMESFSIYGGNIQSTMAGEFTFAWSFSLGFFYMGQLIKAVRDDPRHMPYAAMLLAATALCHILTVMVLIVGSLVVLFWKRGWLRAPIIWAWGFAVAAFWSIPFVLRIPYSTDMAWWPLNDWKEVFPSELWVYLPVAAAGAFWALKKTVRALPLFVMTIGPVIYFPIPLWLKSTFPSIFADMDFKVWNGRLLPYWYFGVILFAAIAVGAFCSYLIRRLPVYLPAWTSAIPVFVLGGLASQYLRSQTYSWMIPGWTANATLGFVILLGIVVLIAALAGGQDGEPRWWANSRALVTSSAVGAITIASLVGIIQFPGWVRWNFEGYEGKGAAWVEYENLMKTIAELPPGRVMWEHNNDIYNRYGTPMSLMLIPHWVGSSHPSMEGLFFESTLSVSFHFINQAEVSKEPSQAIPGLMYHTFDFARGVPHMQMYGVTYYVAVTDSVTNEKGEIIEKGAKTKAEEDGRLTLVAESPPYKIFLVPDSELVDIAKYEVSVLNTDDFERDSHLWYDDLELLDRWMTTHGPSEWRRITDIAQLEGAAALPPSGEVSDVEIGRDYLKFHTTAVGVPHMIKISAFPNWKADGAEGPYRSAPSLMIVIPTEEDVHIYFQAGWVEWLSGSLFWLAMAALAWWVIRLRRGGEPWNDAGRLFHREPATVSAQLASDTPPEQAEGVSGELPDHSES